MTKLYTFFMLFLLTSIATSAQEYQINGSTTVLPNSTQCFQLTPSVGFHQVGTVWSKTPVDLTKNFVVYSKLYFGSQDNGADGIAFVLQNAGLNAIGISGGGIGYHQMPGNSFIIEFDTYQNLQWNFFTGDPVEDHIGFMSQGNAFHNQPTALQPPYPLSQNIEDNQYHTATFAWNASTKTMTLSFLGQTYTYTGDIINTIFGGNPVVFWGFTAATGSDISLSGATQSEQDVCILPPPTCGQLRTQTPGGWGTKPHGNNPGTYLYAHFASAFPSGLVVGNLGSGKYAKFTSASAISDYLPAGGPSKVLTKAYLNPKTEDLKNTLVMHLVALTLSVGFDQADPSFGSAGIQLGDMVIGSGVFAGKTVSEFLTIANQVLAGLNTTYTPQQVLDVATAINENYVDGTTDKGYLECPNAGLQQTTLQQATRFTSQVPLPAGLYVRPNPSAGQFEISSGGLEGRVNIQIVASNGAVVESRNVQISKGQLISFDLTRLPKGVYMVRLNSGTTVQTQKIILQR